jgi:hypothetical protein
MAGCAASAATPVGRCTARPGFEKASLSRTWYLSLELGEPVEEEPVIGILDRDRVVALFVGLLVRLVGQDL